MPPARPRFAFDRPLLVLDVVGLREADLALAPRIRALGERGRIGGLEPALPAVTCTVQASILTCQPPSAHGIVGNGWYFRDLADIHRKPGYDPAELFLDPKLACPKLEIAWTPLKKKLGFRYLMRVVPTDPALVRGSHGPAPASREKEPVFVASSGLDLPERVRAREVLFTR